MSEDTDIEIQMRQVQHRCRRDVRQIVCFEKGQLRFAVVFTNVKGKGHNEHWWLASYYKLVLIHQQVNSKNCSWCVNYLTKHSISIRLQKKRHFEITRIYLIHNTNNIKRCTVLVKSNINELYKLNLCQSSVYINIECFHFIS